MDSAALFLPYLPNVFWFSNFLKHETVFIEREERFVKSTYRNRCEIAAANGNQILSIPIVGGRDHHQFYKKVKIDYSNRWNKKHWQSILSAYGSAPFFEYYADKLQPLYEKQFEWLFEFNSELLYVLLHILKVKKGFDFTATYDKHTTDILDLRSVKAAEEQTEHPRYYQVFEERNGFVPNLSIIDLIFNLGPGAKEYLHSQAVNLEL